MSLEIELATDRDTFKKSVALDATELSLMFLFLTDLRGDFAKLTRLAELDLSSAAFLSVPPCVFELASLRTLDLSSGRLRSLDASIGRLTSLVVLDLSHNDISVLPTSIGRLSRLQLLDCRHNGSLKRLPLEAQLLSSACSFDIDVAVVVAQQPQSYVCRRFSRTEIMRLQDGQLWSLSLMRSRLADFCFGLHDLELPALVTLEIVDAAFWNDVRMWAKWEAITKIKHFHARQQR
jgi:hypothetical protein